MKRCVLELRENGIMIVHRLKKKESLQFLQGIVRGLIERVKPRYLDKLRDGWVNEEGIINGMMPNLYATKLCGHAIFGTMAIVIADYTGTYLDDEAIVSLNF